MTETTTKDGPRAGADCDVLEEEAEGGVSLHPQSVPASSTTTMKNPPSPGTKVAPICKFFSRKQGCRLGLSCRYQHVSPDTSPSAGQGSENATLNTRKTPNPSAPAFVPRPAVADPRAFQIGQIKRRFNPKEETTSNGDLLLTFGMEPSDPDFPFDIEELKCVLRVPPTFPGPGKTDRPSLRITNKQMERGYQINVERGFETIWIQASSPTLLNAVKALDRQLEALLVAKKAETVTFVANTAPRAMSKADEPASVPEAMLSPVCAPPIRAPYVSPERRQEARVKREAEVQILGHRLGRHAQFSKAAEDTLFTIPIEPRKRNELPAALQGVKVVHLLVPTDYDVEHCSIELVDVDREAAAKVESAFTQWAKGTRTGTLLSQINYLASNMHIMAKGVVVVEEEEEERRVVSISAEEDMSPQIVDSATVPVTVTDVAIQDTDREHVKRIPRPPEWSLEGEGVDDGDESDSENYTSSDTDASGREEDDTEEGAVQSTGAPCEKGILISFPGLALYGIELLELTTVNLTVKCERCKEHMDISRIRAQEDANESSNLVSSSCKKCAYAFTIGFRRDLLHAGCTRAGYLDLDGCTPVDLLPSTFLPTCSDCSTTFPASAGVISVRGQSAMAICRNCHKKLNFLIPEVKFLRVGSSGLAHLPLRQAGKIKKESLGLTAGEALPGRGACKHYSKSYRWFRFSCCDKVYPCDRCHDAEQDHPNEFAARMICGWCSREQAYRPEECGMQGCRRGVTGRARTGFWEGGKGTRDKKKMSRKDPRKYKRRGGGALASASKK